MRQSYSLLALALALACSGSGGGGPRWPKQVDGAIGGLTRDRATGEAVGSASLHLHRPGGSPQTTTSTREGLFGFDHLPPGRYDLDAELGSARTTVSNIDVAVGDVTIVDVELTGSASAVNYAGDVVDSAIEQFAPTGHDPHTGLIEGAVSDSISRRRVAGAIVTAIIGEVTLQTASDDQGRFRFDGVVPGRYAISAYYAVDGRGQIEVRRSDIAVDAGSGVRVPLWIEIAR